MYHYIAYGLTFLSDTPVVELKLLDTTPDSVDVNLHFSNIPTEFKYSADPSGENWQPHTRFFQRGTGVLPELRMKIEEHTQTHAMRLRYNAGITFVIDAAGQNLWASSAENVPFDDMCAFLINQGFGFLLRLRNITCLHASAIRVEGKAILLCAPSGYGKSTIASYFATRGYDVISDDICVLFISPETDTVYVQPGYPRLRLLPNSAELINDGSATLVQMPGVWGKYYLHVDSEKYGFAQQALPVQAVYVIADWRNRPSVTPLSVTTAVPVLMQNTYLSSLIDTPLRAEDFRILSQLVNSAAVRSVMACNNLDDLPDLYDLIQQDLHLLTQKA